MLDALEGKTRRILFWLFGLSLLFHVITAYFSVGFFSWDEHFQILEFLSPRLGRGSVAALPWEYAQHLRPWFQSAIYYGVIRVLRELGIQNAAVWTRVLRELSGILSWFTLLLLTIVSMRWFQTERLRRIVIVLAALLCFFPFIDARTSAENLSAAFFFLGFSAFFLAHPKRAALYAGLLMGASIQVRYQNAFMLLGFLGYLAWGKQWKPLAWILGMGLLVSVGGVFVDHWGYGQWTFVPWNYFKVNLLEGKANSFSRDPIWFYFSSYSTLMPPIGGLCFLAAIVGWFRKPLHVLTWVTLPFFLVHCLIPHKEIRFLFPILPAVPFLVAFGLESFSEARLRRTWRHLRWVLIPSNFLLLVIFAFKPAYSPFLLYGFVDGHPEIHRIYFRDENPFVQIRSLQTNFFKTPGLKLIQAPSYAGLEQTLEKDHHLWLFEGSAALPAQAGMLKSHCVLRFTAFPRWLNVLDFIPGIRFANRRSLFFCSL